MSEPLKVALLALNTPGYQSLALGYLRAYASSDSRLKGRIAFQTLDLTVDDEPWWIVYRLASMKPDLLAVAVYCWSAHGVFDVCRLLKRVLPEVRIVLGGPEVGPIAENVLRHHNEIEAVVRGEGEAAFADIVDCARRGKVFTHIEGVTARDGRNSIVAAPDRPLIRDLDEIPSPYLSGVLEPVEGAAYIETFRGCPHRCAYCFEGKGYQRVRSFGRARVEAEIAYLAQDKGVRSFTFVDSIFNLNAERLEWLTSILAPYAARGVQLHTVEVDIEQIDDKTAAALKRAGVVSVETGPQSTGGNALRICHRRFNRERFVAGVLALKRAGIQVECDLIAGLPGDTPQSFLESLEFCIALDPGKVQISTLHLLPGTELYERAAELGLVFDMDPPHELINTSTISFPDLRRLEARSVFVTQCYSAHR